MASVAYGRLIATSLNGCKMTGLEDSKNHKSGEGRPDGLVDLRERIDVGLDEWWDNKWTGRT